MGALTSLQLGRVSRVARRSGEVWQVAAVRLPRWIANEEDQSLPPTRAFGVVCRSVRTGLIHIGMPESREVDAIADCVLSTCLEFGVKCQRQLEGRPATIHVADRHLREALELRRDQLDADIVIVPELSGIREVLREMEADTHGFIRPSLLDDVGVSSERVRAFAGAAADFYRAAPWRWLDGEDLIVIEQSNVPRSLMHFSVLGAAGEQFGLGFYDNRGVFERVSRGHVPERAVSVTYGPIDEMPFGDVDLWEDEQLPVAGPEAYPVPAELRARRKVRRPTAVELRVMEACLRAMSIATEDDLDAGRWSVTVETCDGPMQLTLSLPQVVAALEAPISTPSMLAQTAEFQKRLSAFLGARKFRSIAAANKALSKAVAQGAFSLDDGAEPQSPAEQALQLAGRAMEIEGRAQVALARRALARRALALDPNCADAWLALLRAASSHEEAVGRARSAVDAARRSLGETAFAEAVGSFWLIFDTRPYMRAMAELADLLRESGDAEAAIRVWQEMLRLNPNDNQGVRYLLLLALLPGRRHTELDVLVERYKDDVDASWQFGRALSVFSREGA